MDLHGAVDEAVKQGIADPDRLGIGGWSYGGISTDAAIATDTRFKAAVSGAGVALYMSLYGVDQYIIQYDQELGPPWRNKDAWAKMSFGFFNADKIKTPTLYHGRREGLQRADRRRRTDVSGAEEPRRRYAARGLPGTVPRTDDPELRARSAAALPELVQQVPAADATTTTARQQ